MGIGSVDGLISGMSTTDVINQLIQAEAVGQTAIKKRISTAQKAVSGLQSINSKFSALASAADALTKFGALSAMKATSSSTAITATATSSALSGSLTFDVVALAKAEQHASTSNHALTDTVAAGQVSITQGGNTTTIDVSDNTLEGVVSAINAAKTGVRASAVQVSPGQYKLQLSSTTTGAASDFSIGGLSIDTAEMVAGTDAKLHVGPTNGGYDITSATNTFTGVLPGVSIQASKVESGITVDVNTDTDAVTKKVQDLVNALNATKDELGKQAAFNSTDTTKNGPLQGDFLVQTLTNSLMSSVTRVGSGQTLSAIGIELSRDGKVNFDAAKFGQALAADPAKVNSLIGLSSTFNGAASGISVISMGNTTTAGDHNVVITQAATQASGSYDIASVAAGQTYAITLNGKTASYTAADGDGLSEVVAGLRAGAAAQGVSVGISRNGSRVDITAGAYGSGQSLSLADVAGASVSATAGQDVAGTIDGKTATGKGRSLSLADGSSSEMNLTVTVSTAQIAAGQGSGVLALQPGFAQRVKALAKAASDSGTGQITTAIERRNNLIKGFNDQVDAWDVRLEMRRTTLKRQFNAMEVALGKMKSQSSWLAGQIAGLPS